MRSIASRAARTIAVLLAAALVCGAAATGAQEVALEYRVKAAYLFNFTKFVDWPADPAGATPLTICVASPNPFGSVLAETIREERVNERPLQARTVRDASGCHVLFVPRGVPHQPYLRAARGQPILTVGETPAFLRDGGIISFVVEENKVRFDIGREAAARANLTISSRLLRLARAAVSGMAAHRWHGE